MNLEKVCYFFIIETFFKFFLLELAESAKEFGKTGLEVVGGIRKPSVEDMEKVGKDLKTRLENVFGALEKLTGALKSDSSEVLADLVENELADMEKAIEEAAKKIEVCLKFGTLQFNFFFLGIVQNVERNAFGCEIRSQ